MNQDQAAKNDLGASSQQGESRPVTDKLDSANKQHAKKPNVKPDGDKKEEYDSTVTNINEKNASAKQQSNLAKTAPKPGTTKTTAKNPNLELPVSTPAANTTTSQTSTIHGAARGSKLAANSDSGIDSTGTDVSPSTVKDLSSHSENSNTQYNKRGAGNHQVTNGSLSESLTSADGSRTPNSENLSKTNLYIRGLSSNTTDDDLYNMCAKYGNILSTKAIFDKTTGCCRGYGFVQYTTPQSAETAVAELNKSGTLAQMARLPTFHQSHNQHYAHQHHHQNHHHSSNHHANHYNHNDHHSHYNRSNPGGNMNSYSSAHIHDNNGNHTNNNHADPTNLYIANLPLDMSEEDLETLLSTYGPVISTRILRDERNMTRGVGFARMETRDKCQEVIEKLNGKPCKGSKEPLLVKFADGGNRKRHHHQNNHHHPNHHLPHHQRYTHEDHRWREESQATDPNNVSTFEQHGNISHNNQMPDLSMMAPMGYRMPQPYPSNINPAAYPGAPGSQPGGLWIHPGQPWNVIQQQMIPPTGMGAPNQPSANPGAYSYAHLPQLTSQMQGLQIAHHPGAHMGGYLPPHHQWSVWPPPVPHQQPSIRVSGVQQGPAGPHQTETAPTKSESTLTTIVSGKDAVLDAQHRQTTLVGERAKQVPAPIS